MNTKYKDDNAAIDNHTDLSLIGKKFLRYINQPVKKKSTMREHIKPSINMAHIKN